MSLRNTKKKLINQDSELKGNYKTGKGKLFASVIYLETDNSSGTGFLFTEDGYAITCAHVVNNKEEIFARIVSSNEEVSIAKAEIVAINTEVDIAIIKLEGKDYNFCEIDESCSKMMLGDDIVILGYPFGKQVHDDVLNLSLSFTKGHISSAQKKNNVEQVLLDISAKAGNSGSPVISIEKGCVIGVLCGSVLGGSEKHTEEINYMRPIKYIFNFFE